MPDETNDSSADFENSVLDQEDDLELLSGLEAAAREGPDVPGQIPRNRYTRAALESRMPRKHALAFVAAVELDLLRGPGERLGLEELFQTCMPAATEAWLNPAPYIKHLYNIVLRFSGPHRTFTPFVRLLIDAAATGISPAAFCRYVLFPRMARDYNWRNWERNHLAALRLILELLADLTREPPFDRERIEAPFVVLARDIVLVKYVGRPLANLPRATLEDQALIGEYRAAWQGLTLGHAQYIFFIKRNVLPLLYWLTGKVRPEQIVSLTVKMAGLEEHFRASLPENLYRMSEAFGAISLYSRNYTASLAARRNRGFKYTDFVTEMEAFLDMIEGLLSLRCGIVLAGYLTRNLTNAAGPVRAQLIGRMIRALGDRPGMHFYRWHVQRMLAREGPERLAYLERIEALAPEGDPEYPDFHLLFAQERLFPLGGEVVTHARSIGVTMEELGQQIDVRAPDLRGRRRAWRRVPRGRPGYPDDFVNLNATYADLLNVLIHKDPGLEVTLRKYQKEFSAGQDRGWGPDEHAAIDALGTTFYVVLLRSVIIGLGSHLVSGLKASSMSDLQRRFPVRLNAAALEQVNRFKLPLVNATEPDRLHEQEIRRQINLELIGIVWDSLRQKEAVTPGMILPAINALYMNLHAPLAAKREELRDAATDQAVQKLTRSVEVMAGKQAAFARIMESFDELSPERTFVTAVILAAAESKPGQPFARLALGLAGSRFAEHPDLQTRLDFLRHDISVEFLGYEQFTNLLNTLEILGQLLVYDAELQKAFEFEEDPAGRAWQELLRPYATTRTKRLDMETFEAAFRKICAWGKLQAERARWQQLIEALDSESEKYYRHLRLYTSRTCLDAYYGDMGAICLSEAAGMITDENFYNIRLLEEAEDRIAGMGLLFRSQQGCRSIGAREFWFAFAFNPLNSLLRELGAEQQLMLYLEYRKILEAVARASGLPVLLPGILRDGIVSNRPQFQNLIIDFEARERQATVRDARGLDLYYSAASYAHAFVIIDPHVPASFRAARAADES